MLFIQFSMGKSPVVTNLQGFVASLRAGLNRDGAVCTLNCIAFFFVQDSLPGSDFGLENSLLLPLYFGICSNQKTYQERRKTCADQWECRVGNTEERGEQLYTL